MGKRCRASIRNRAETRRGRVLRCAPLRQSPSQGAPLEHRALVQDPAYRRLGQMQSSPGHISGSKPSANLFGMVASPAAIEARPAAESSDLEGHQRPGARKDCSIQRREVGGVLSSARSLRPRRVPDRRLRPVATAIRPGRTRSPSSAAKRRRSMQVAMATATRNRQILGPKRSNRESGSGQGQPSRQCPLSVSSTLGSSRDAHLIGTSALCQFVVG
jgi:hypothetical protein